MTLAPPPTEFYDSSRHSGLWYQMVGLLIDFSKTDQQRQQRLFGRVLNDLVITLDPLNCQRCGTPTVNVAEDGLTHLRCPECKWEPVKEEVDDQWW